MNISAYLKKLDGEITAHRQQIALHQLEIAKIEDARRTIIGIEEREAGHFGADHGLEAVIVARAAPPPQPQLLTASEAGEAKKEGKRPYTTGKPDPKGSMTSRVLEVLQGPDAPMSTYALREALGILDDRTKTKRLHGALNNLKSRGEIDWDSQHHYFRADAPAPKPQVQGGLSFGQTPGAVLDALTKSGEPLTSGEIVTAVYGQHKPGAIAKADRDRVYGAVLALKRSGKVTKGEDGRYRTRQQAAE